MTERTPDPTEVDAEKALSKIDKRIAWLEAELAEDRKLRRRIVTLRNKFRRLVRGR